MNVKQYQKKLDNAPTDSDRARIANAEVVRLRRVIAHVEKINKQPATTVDRAREISAESTDYIWHETVEFKGKG